jgi:hypothetical protein
MESITLRSLFPDDQSVKIYPDDFQDDPKNIIFPDLVGRKDGHFSDRRVTVMFRPGSYKDINFPVGYWTQVIGLGSTPDKVEFTGSLGVYAIPANTDDHNVGSLDTFWRSAENFKSSTAFILDAESKPCTPVVVKDDVNNSLKPKGNEYPHLYPLPSNLDGVNDFKANEGMLWAVSQAAPMRRIQIKENLHLSLGDNNASGGFIGNVNIGGYLLLGSQQQFCVRNCNVDKKAAGGAWSMVLKGCSSSMSSESVEWVGDKPALICESHESDTKIIEKPFLFLDDKDVLYLGIPKVALGAGNGINHHEMSSTERVIVDNDKQVKVFSPCAHFSDIQATAEKGIHVVLSPGTYNWDKTLVITQHNQVVLGLGMATIQAPGDGSPCIHVRSKLLGVRLSGLALESSVISKFIYKGSTLLQWGDADCVGKDLGKSFENNPGAIHDLYCFVGGRSLHRTVKVECMVKIFSSNVVGDNLWLWRADHVKLTNQLEKPNMPELSEYHVTTMGECQCDTGLIVFGDHVTFYGLAVEHTYKDMVSWHGKYGRVYFYQSELPYDVSGDVYDGKTIVGYRVNVGADHHLAKGVGVYSYFRDYNDVHVYSAIGHHAFGGKFEIAFTVWLNGFSGLRHVINGHGEIAKTPGKPYFVDCYRGEKIWSLHFLMGLGLKLKSLIGK